MSNHPNICIYIGLYVYINMCVKLAIHTTHAHIYIYIHYNLYINIPKVQVTNNSVLGLCALAAKVQQVYLDRLQ